MKSGEDARNHQKLSEIRHKKYTLEQEINNINIKINNDKIKLDKLKQDIDKKTIELKQVNEKLIELKDVKLRDVSTVKKELNEISEKELTGYKLLAAREGKLQELNQFLLPTSDHCPYCLQEINTEHRDECNKTI